MIPEYVDFTDSVGESLKKLLISNKYTRVIVLCDENSLRDCYTLIENELPQHSMIEITSGEENKNLKTCEDIWSRLTASKADRSSVLLNLGGGVIGDMGGFCAATYKRGIDFIQIPTTLLSQVDASVGGKLGIDFEGLKNHIGVFKLPARVIIDPVFLETLSDRQIRSGFAEIIKHGLIKDQSVFDDLFQRKYDSNQNWLTTIRRSVEIKGEIVASDPLEKGSRKLLNFGHTIGHAVESYFLGIEGKKLLHGEAIAIGMICEAWLSSKKLALSGDQLDKIAEFIKETYGKIDLNEIDEDVFLTSLNQDKKNKGNTLLFTLLHEIGIGKFDIPVSSVEVLESLEYYKSI